MGIRYEKELNKRQCLICGKPATIIYDDWPFCEKKHANEWKQITKKGKKIVKECRKQLRKIYDGRTQNFE